ncbi:cysteine desulfurase, partial [Mycolicibacterium sphagni]|nr:cysteine desulfurase [Mycolicibacterium sphagni]
MSTSEYRSVDAEGDLPISEAELAAMANQLFAASFRPGNDSPPQTTPPAPRGSVPDTTSAAGYAQSAVGSRTHLEPAAAVSAPSLVIPAPSSSGPEPIPPYSVPVAPRGSAPDLTSVTSAGHAGSGMGSSFNPPNLGESAVPDGIMPMVPGVLAGARPAPPVAPRGSTPGWSTEVPGIPDLSFLSAPELASAPTGDEASYYFISGAPALPEPVPQYPDRHEIFDVDAIRADFPILRETVNGKPLIWFDNAATTQKPQAVIDRL